jgi:hypothetical protein
VLGDAVGMSTVPMIGAVPRAQGAGFLGGDELRRGHARRTRIPRPRRSRRAAKLARILKRLLAGTTEAAARR